MGWRIVYTVRFILLRAMAKTCIIVPVYNEEEHIGAFFQRLLPVLDSGPDIELLVVDGGSSDRTVSIVRSFGVTCLLGPRGRARQMNFAAAQANTDYLLFLHCDTVLPDTFVADFSRVLSSHALWGFFTLRLTGVPNVFRIIERAISWRSTLTGIATGDQGIFVRRDLWLTIGGYGDLALMEDVELCQRLRRFARPAVIASPLTTSSRRWERRGVVKTVLLMWWLRTCFWVGLDAKTLARWYR